MTKQQSVSMSRRAFLKDTGLIAVGATIGFPSIIPSKVLGAEAPSKKINIGMIGCGRQAMYSNLLPFMQSPDCVVVAMCDVDSWRLEQGLNAVRKHYDRPSCKGYRDFRELLAREDIDAVMISTPDHWHVPMAVAAVKAGKDVALEKPITRSIHEGRVLANLVKKHKRVFRVDSEFRSRIHFHMAVELVVNGRIGKLHTIRTGAPREFFPKEPDVITPPPAELDYDLWLGPAPQVDYIQKRVHPPRDLLGRPGWMRNLDYCDGMITNWGTHLNDIAQWGAGTERTGPVEIKASGRFHDDKVWNVLEEFTAWYKFANGVELFYEMGTPHVRFEGEKGWIQVSDAGKLSASDPALLRDKVRPDEIKYPLRPEKTDFIQAMKTRGETMEDAEVGHRTTSLCHLAHISIKLGGGKLRWDPERELFLDNEAANKLIAGPALRSPWQIEEF